MKTPFSGIRAWLFDFDNTLAALEREVDWPGGRRKLETFLRAEFAKRGLDPAVFTEIPRGNLPLYAALHARWLRAAANRPISDAAATLAFASAIIEEIELAGVDRAAPLPGAIELLRDLAASGRAVAIVTSNSSRTAMRWLARYRMADSVHAIVGRDSALALKPSPEMVLRALELCDTRPAEAIFVGDSEADYRAAIAANVRFIAMAPNDQANHWLKSVELDETVQSPMDLAARFLDKSRAESGWPGRSEN